MIGAGPPSQRRTIGTVPRAASEAGGGPRQVTGRSKPVRGPVTARKPGRPRSSRSRLVSSTSCPASNDSSSSRPSRSRVRTAVVGVDELQRVDAGHDAAVVPRPQERAVGPRRGVRHVVVHLHPVELVLQPLVATARADLARVGGGVGRGQLRGHPARRSVIARPARAGRSSAGRRRPGPAAPARPSATGWWCRGRRERTPAATASSSEVTCRCQTSRKTR